VEDIANREALTIIWYDEVDWKSKGDLQQASRHQSR
jgi:hypothetical protein